MNTNVASQSTYNKRRAIFALGVVLAALAVYFILLPLVILAGQAGAELLSVVHGWWVAAGFPVSPTIYN